MLGRARRGPVESSSAIADPKPSADATLHSVAPFEVLLEHAPFGAYLVDARFRIAAVNRAAKPVFGGSVDVVGEDFAAVMRRLWPEHYAEEVLAHFRRTLDTGERCVVSERAEVRRDLERVEYYEWQTHRVPLSSGEFGVVCYFRDISREVAAREDLVTLAREPERLRRLYETVLSNTPDLVYVFDLEHRFAYANAALLQMWGRSWTEAIGRNCLELGYEPWHAEMHDREIDQVVATRQPIRGEVPFHGTNGRRIYDYIFVPIIGPDGEVEAVAGTTRDVTAQRQAANELQTLADTLAEADRRKDEFIALLSHELRNPLAPISNALQVVRMAGGDSALSARAFDVMERQVAQMVRLVDDLLDINRISRGKITLQREQIDLVEVARVSLDACQSLATSRGQALRSTLPEGPLPLRADPARLGQIIGNLLTNACKFTPCGGNVTLHLESDRDGAVLRVRDDGIGIASDQLPRIFEMFIQLDTSLERPTGGLGIGLSLVKSLVELHGGTIAASSGGPGLGSEFEVRLPMAAST
jgi:PAS domain S-box-containing protein